MPRHPRRPTTGAPARRRGEAGALRGSGVRDGLDAITRSLCQVRQTLHWKGTKTGEERNVKIPGVTTEAFERRRAEQAKARAAFPDYNRSLDLVFADPGGDPLKPDSVSSKVSLLCRKLKLPEGTSLHTLRHSHFSQLVADGADVGAVAARAGTRTQVRLWASTPTPFQENRTYRTNGKSCKVRRVRL